MTKYKKINISEQACDENIEKLEKLSELLSQKEAEIKEKEKLYHEIEKTKTQFVSVAAHQLRTPLAAIKWTFQMLLSGDFGPLNQEQTEALERGNTMNNQIIQLVDDLLNVSRIESGKFDKIPFGDIDLKRFLSEIKSMYTEKADVKKIKFDMQIPERGEFIIKGSRDHLRMVFQNLIDNAFNYTPAEGSINVTYLKRGNIIEFAFKDSGIGISEKDKAKLFEKFFRGDKATKTQTEGTGLGLFIVKNILRLHKGNIQIESTEGEGSTFLISLPLAKNE